MGGRKGERKKERGGKDSKRKDEREIFHLMVPLQMVVIMAKLRPC